MIGAVEINTHELQLPYLVVLSLWCLLWMMRSAAGRLAPRVAILPIIFLITRKPILLAWGVGATGMFALLVPAAVARGHDTLSDLLAMGGLSALCGLGFAALTVGPVWAAVRAFTPIPVFPLEPGETVLLERAANHFVGGESRGGKLLVTTRRLGFRPHRLNVQLSTWSARFEEIRGLSIEGDRFLLVETTQAGKAEWIVAWKPQQLVQYIGALSGCPEGERVQANEEALVAAGLKTGGAIASLR